MNWNEIEELISLILSMICIVASTYLAFTHEVALAGLLIGWCAVFSAGAHRAWHKQRGEIG
jgi:hypothetical protein